MKQLALGLNLLSKKVRKREILEEMDRVGRGTRRHLIEERGVTSGVHPSRPLLLLVQSDARIVAGADPAQRCRAEVQFIPMEPPTVVGMNSA